MTTTQLIFVASLLGAVLFFAAGAAVMALRQRSAPPPLVVDPSETEPTQVRKTQPALPSENERLQAAELARLRYALDGAEATVHSQAAVIEEQNRLLERDVTNDRAATARDMQALRSEAQELRRVAADRARQLERSRTDSVGAARELAQLHAKLRDVEQQLADKTASMRDLSTETEQLKGRLRDAEALRAEYVRLRTATTDSEYLKSEIARLEKELRAVRVDALGARGIQPRTRPARGTDRQPTSSEPTVGESLARVIERFADAGTRSSALGDPQGFPLASTGSDGVALAAYAAHLFESAARAKEYLPVTAPSVIEIIDTNGVRVSVWALEVESDRLMLANLAVSPVDAKRVETTLGDLTRILAPASGRSGAARAELP